MTLARRMFAVLLMLWALSPLGIIATAPFADGCPAARVAAIASGIYFLGFFFVVGAVTVIYHAVLVWRDRW